MNLPFRLRTQNREFSLQNCHPCVDEFPFNAEKKLLKRFRIPLDLILYGHSWLVNKSMEGIQSAKIPLPAKNRSQGWLIKAQLCDEFPFNADKKILKRFEIPLSRILFGHYWLVNKSMGTF